MHADTSALHHLAAAQARHATDLADAAARLAAASPSTDAFGPVGVRFLTAVSDALASEAHAAAHLGERLAAAGQLATTTAGAYVDAERRAGNAVGSVGV